MCVFNLMFYTDYKGILQDEFCYVENGNTFDFKDMGIETGKSNILVAQLN